jgi:DNA-nicking Smr family endonuclease
MKISDEDKALFREAMKTVRPLSQQTPRAPEPPVPANPLRRKHAPDEKPQTTYYLSNHYTETVSPTSTLTWCIPDFPHKRLKALGNGDIRWEARLDLHGFKPDIARETLCRFIDQQSQSEKRCLLIIHGKGGRHDHEPVLKNLVNHWLQQLPQVLAFHSAIPRDGGTGAVYVLLKKSIIHPCSP